MCPNCKKRFNAKAPVLPRSLYGNNLTAQVAVMHYFHGIPTGRICEMTGINVGSLVDIFRRLGRYFLPAMEALKNAYRAVLHTINKRRAEQSLESVFKGILDKIAENPAVDVTSLILPAPEQA
ncbi:MAG: hypothetical protein ABSB94_06095 [Syntrophorhabdales bacterium]